MTDEQINDIIIKLNAATDVLTKDTHDMDVIEFNATPIGRACRLIQDAIEMLEEAET